jgi:membrane-bound serine protease (ClpP class)
MVDPLIWAGLLLLVGLALVMTEVFIPSGGILGVLAFVAIIAAIAMAFLRSGAFAGFMFVLVSLIAVPTILVFAFQWLPDTAVGKRLLAAVPTSEEVLPDDEQRRALRELVGKVGRAKSRMLPSGAVQIEGRTIDAVSDGFPIEPGQPVRVMEVTGTQVTVRLVTEEVAASAPAAKADDVLAQSIDKLGLDPFEDPLA